MEQLTAFILNELQNLVVVASPSGKLTYVNKYTFDLLGLNSPQGNLFAYRNNLVNAKQITGEISQALNVSDQNRYEKPLLTGAGSMRWISWNVSRDEAGNLIGIGYDITEKKKAEIDLREKTLQLVEKQNEVISSIQYAQRIQEALLPEVKRLEKYFSGAMVYYKPRDYVSGDFYWLAKSGNFIFIAVADCTGHGVPGAMMAVMGNSFLNNAVKKHGVTNCHDILMEVDRELHMSLNHKGYGARDGMDLSLLRIDTETLQAQYCGAMRNALLFSKGSLTELKGSKYPLGFYDNVEKEFTNTDFVLEKGDRIYLFTDGYVDQFGGVQNENDREKKFRKNNFIELLQSLTDMPMGEQENYLDYVFENWKQHLPQTDDVTVLGVEI